MKIGPRYKIARRLGAHLFNKTETQKFALRSSSRGGRGRPPSNYGKQLLEKQQARFIYGVMNRQLARYAREAVSEKNPEESLWLRLERRLDNTVYLLGFAASRQAARQLVSHGHMTVNGRRVTIPSYTLSVGDTVSVREGSRKRKLWGGLEERAKTLTIPEWLFLDSSKLEGKVKRLPAYVRSAVPFNVAAIIEFYRR